VVSEVNLGQTDFTEIAFASKSKAAAASVLHTHLSVSYFLKQNFMTVDNLQYRYVISLKA
jgi:hypothetical protein